jgi:hypothetical protein
MYESIKPECTSSDNRETIPELKLVSIGDSPLKLPIKSKYKHTSHYSNFEDQSFKSKLNQPSTLDMVNSLPKNNDVQKLPSNIIIIYFNRKSS